MTEPSIPTHRPSGVTGAAATFLFAGTYLIVIGGLMFAWQGAVSMTMGSPLLNGLEIAGPYMFLLMGAVGVAIGFGLLKLNNWARRAAIVAALLGMVMLIPSVSAATVDFRPALFWSGLGVVVRVVIVWYLYQAPVTEAFQER
ncbi:MAG: hypothetical protein ACHP8A_10030 [Terriglobales bacterium]